MSLILECTKKLRGYDPKVSPWKSGVAAVMMLLANADPMNSNAVAPDRGQRTPRMCPASAAGFLEPWYEMAEPAMTAIAMVRGARHHGLMCTTH